MTTITHRVGGSMLTNAQVDANFDALNAGKVEKTGDTMTGNLIFSGNAIRIKADFSGTGSPGLTNRLLFQDSGVNANTFIGALPAGSNVSAGWIGWNNSTDLANAAFVRTYIDGTATYLQSSVTGTGTQLPIKFQIGATTALSIDTGYGVSVLNGNLGVNIGNISASLGNLIIGGTGSFGGAVSSSSQIANVIQNYWEIASSTNPSDRQDHEFRRARGTLASKAAVVSGDYIGFMRWRAYNATLGDYAYAADIFVQSGTPSGNFVPGTLNISTSDGTGFPAIRATILPSGYVGFNTTTPPARVTVAHDLTGITDSTAFRCQSAVGSTSNLLFGGSSITLNASFLQSYKEGTSAGVRPLYLNPLGGDVCSWGSSLFLANNGSFAPEIHINGDATGYPLSIKQRNGIAGTAGAALFKFYDSGQFMVGAFTGFPVAKMHILSNNYGAADLQFNYDGALNYRNSIWNTFSGGAAVNNQMLFRVSNAGATTFNDVLYLYGDSTAMFPGLGVGIGMTPAYRLDVNGNFRATQVKVDTTPNNGAGFDQSASQISLASGATYDLGTGSGLLIINDTTVTGHVAVFTVGGAVVTLISQGGTEFAASDTAGKIGLFYNAGLYRLHNQTGVTVLLGVASIRTRVST